MRYLYLIQLSNPTRCHAFRTPETVTLIDYAKAEEMGYKWLCEEEAVALKLQVPNGAGNWNVISPSRCLYVKAKVEDRAIWIQWLDKWRSIREYRTAGKYPSKAVMEKVEATFRLNAGVPINFSMQIEFDTNY